MAHFSTIRTPVTNWIDGTTVLPSELEALDAEQASAVNGDDGGVYAPTSLMTIAGSGLQTTVPLAILRGGLLKTAASDSIELQDGDFPTLGATHTGRSRVVVFPTCTAKGFPSWLWRVRKEDSGLQAYAPSWTTIANGQTIAQPGAAYVPIRAANGATLSKVEVFFRVGQSHNNPPPVMPRLRVCRMDRDGTIVALTSQTAGGDVDGYVSIPGPSSGAAWYARGAAQSLAIACDQNNVIDLANYDYLVEIIEESGLTGSNYVVDRAASPSWENAVLSAASKTTLWAGPTWQQSHAYNAGDVAFPTTADVTNGIYFQITTAGTSATTEPSWPSAIGATVTDGGAVWTALGTTQKFGNIWQAVRATYIAIDDTRWQ